MEKKGKPVRYLANPDVVLREEDPDGALLFNPDTNDVKVINETGIHIWKACEEAITLEEIIRGMEKQFQEVPANEVEQHTREFLDQMIRSGFVGEVVEEE